MLGVFADFLLFQVCVSEVLKPETARQVGFSEGGAQCKPPHFSHAKYASRTRGTVGGLLTSKPVWHLIFCNRLLNKGWIAVLVILEVWQSA